MINSILIVEDESFFSDILCDALYLVDIDARKKVISTAEEAIEYYKSIMHNKPDVVLLDINLVGSVADGIDVLRTINFELGNDVVIGMISGSTDEVDIARCVKAGAQFYIVKTDDLTPKLEEFKKDYEGFKNRITREFKIYK